MLGLILPLNMSYFLTATEGIDIYSSLLETDRHLKYGHKSLKKSAKEVGVSHGKSILIKEHSL